MKNRLFELILKAINLKQKLGALWNNRQLSLKEKLLI